MTMTIRARAFVAWVALAAILLGSFVPLASQALGLDAPGHRTDVCSARGLKPSAGVTTAPGQGGPPSPGHSMLAHCSLCPLHANPVGLPPALLSALPTAVFDNGKPPRRRVALPPWIEWVTAQPRAPPTRMGACTGTRSSRT